MSEPHGGPERGDGASVGRRTFLLKVAGGVVGAGALVGLGATAGARGLVPHSAGGDPKSLSISWWAEANLSAYHVQVLHQYEHDHPGVTIEAQYQPLNGYDDKLSTELAGGNAPDVFMLRRQTFADYISRGAVRQLDDLVPALLPFDRLPEALQRAAQYKGHWYAIPLGLATSPAIIADRTVLDDLGIAQPPTDWGLEAFESTLRAIHAKSGGRMAGIADLGGQEPPLTGYLAGKGKLLFDDDGRPGFTKDDLGTWFGLWDGWRKDGLVPPMSITAAATGFTTDPLVKGRSAMSSTASSKGLNGLQSLVKHTLELHAFPRATSGGPSATAVGPIEWFALSSRLGAAKAQQAAKLCLTFVDDRRALQALNLAHGVPLFADDRTALYSRQSAVNKLLYDNVAQIQRSGAAPSAAYPPGATEVLTEVTNQNQQVGFGRSSVDQAVDRVFDAVARAL